jgi:GntR family transcriptional regulator, rspAB operon transcriptional repressor
MDEALLAELSTQLARRQDTSTTGVMLYNRLFEAIIQGELLPGLALSEADLSKRLAVSRQLVRETFIKLAERKLLVILPQRGTFVVKISPKRVLEARWVRETIETRIAAELAERADSKLLDGLRGLVMRQRQVPQGDYRQFQALDDAFHRAMAIAVGRAYAWEIVEQSKAQMDRVRFLSLTMLTPFDMLADQHMQIIDALASGNPTAAANATAEHLHVLEHTLPEIVRVHPELFDEAPVR